MKIDAAICYRGIFPISQQIVGGRHLWKLISDIANAIIGKKVEETHKLRDFTYGLITILPVVGTIFNLFLYIVVFQSSQDEMPVERESEEMTTPMTEEIEYSDSEEHVAETTEEPFRSKKAKEHEGTHTPNPSLEENSEGIHDGFKPVKKKKKFGRVMSVKDIFSHLSGAKEKKV